MIKYKKMVKNLTKSGEEILATLDSNKVHCWHMASALLGEGLELHQAVLDNDVANVLEELGDIEFYLEGLEQCIGCQTHTYEEIINCSEFLQNPIHLPILLNALEQIFDGIKKWAIYNKGFSDLDMCQRIDRARHYLALLYRDFEISRQSVLKLNLNKLEKRYSSGTYSDQQAQQRADKN